MKKLQKCKIIDYFHLTIGPLHDPVTWYGINYAGTQITQWDFQIKGKSGWTGTSSFVLKVLLHYLRPSIIYSAPFDRIVQRAYLFMEVRKSLMRKKKGRHANLGRINSIPLIAVRKQNVSKNQLKCIWHENFFPLIWKAFQNTEEWCFSFWNIFFRFRDIDVFLLCKLGQWWRHIACT